jgi:hypothetical protein
MLDYAGEKILPPAALAGRAEEERKVNFFIIC